MNHWVSVLTRELVLLFYHSPCLWLFSVLSIQNCVSISSQNLQNFVSERFPLRLVITHWHVYHIQLFFKHVLTRELVLLSNHSPCLWLFSVLSIQNCVSISSQNLQNFVSERFPLRLVITHWHVYYLQLFFNHVLTREWVLLFYLGLPCLQNLVNVYTSSSNRNDSVCTELPDLIFSLGRSVKAQYFFSLKLFRKMFFVRKFEIVGWVLW